MTAKSMKQLNTILSEVLANTLKKKQDSENVLKAFSERKSELSKVLSASGRSSGKKKKDPNAPKRWRSGYILFCQAEREKLKKNKPTLSATELTSELGAMWKALSDNKKKRYVEESKKDRERYDEEMKSYTPPETSEEDSSSGRSRGSKKERTGPKRPLSSYMFFCQVQRETVKNENPEMKGKEITSELGRRWKELTEDEKQPYIRSQAEDKARYEAEVAEANGGSSPAKGKAPPAPVKASAPAKGKTSAPAKGKVTPVTPAKGKVAVASNTPGFKAFCEETRSEITEENPDWNTRKVTAELQKRWESLNSDDREAYETEAAENSDQEVEASDD
jgi:hypothetical protein